MYVMYVYMYMYIYIYVYTYKCIECIQATLVSRCIWIP